MTESFDCHITVLDHLYIKEASRNGTWCTMRYTDHPRGCPNYGKSEKCPPKAPRAEDLIGPPYYMIYTTFDLKAHSEHLKRRAESKGKKLSDRQAKCVRYWQKSVMKKLRESGKEFTARKNLMLLEIPEANGVNVFKTARRAGIPIKPRPQELVIKVMIAGKMKGQKQLNLMRYARRNDGEASATEISLDYWVSCNNFTVAVRVKSNIITKAPPIVRRFVGQDLDSLVNWAKSRFGSVRVELLGA